MSSCVYRCIIIIHYYHHHHFIVIIVVVVIIMRRYWAQVTGVCLPVWVVGRAATWRGWWGEWSVAGGSRVVRRWRRWVPWQPSGPSRVVPAAAEATAGIRYCVRADSQSCRDLPRCLAHAASNDSLCTRSESRGPTTKTN